MKLYIDKEFLDNFFIGYDESNIYQADVLKFFRKLKGFQLVINFNNQDEFEKQVVENPILELLINEFIPEITYIPDLKSKISEEDFYLKDTYPFKIFFAENSDECNQNLLLDFGYEYISTSNLSERWKCYYSEREDTRMKVRKKNDYPEELRFDSYEKLKKFCHPINCILVFDLYVLSNTPGKQEIKDNLIPLLKNLISFVPRKLKLQIQIVTEKFYPWDSPKDIKTIYDELKRLLLTFLPVDSFELSIVRHHKKQYRKNQQGLSFRRIFTNYITIESDKSFTYFKTNGSVNTLSNINFVNTFDSKNWKSTSLEINEIGNYVTLLPMNDEYDLLYYKSKINRLINIAQN